MSDEQTGWKPKRPIRKNYLDRAGAEALRDKIKDTWVAQGFAPPAFQIQPGGCSDKTGNLSHFALRSDMRNGWPRKRIDG